MKKHWARILIYGGLVFVLGFYYYGRSFWYPQYIKLSGKQTSLQVYEKLGPELDEVWQVRFDRVGLNYPPNKLCLIALKNEKILELWSVCAEEITFIHQYKFSGFSGELGPKLKLGDLQIPEGLYKLVYLNPNSAYHLSMKIDYPNKFDREQALIENRVDLGDNIFIHGKAATIGCIPIGDKAIEELFILIYRVGIDNVDVVIAPNDLRVDQPMYENDEVKWLEKKYSLIKNKLQRFVVNNRAGKDAK